MTHGFSFPVATHTYFRVTNKAAQRELFLTDPTYDPVFTYGTHMDEKKVDRRLNIATNNPSVQDSLRLVQASLQLQKTHGKAELRRFRDLNEQIFRAPHAEYVVALLVRLHSFVTPETNDAWRYIRGALDDDFVQMPDIVPPKEVFDRYRQFFTRYHGESTEGATPLPELLEADLDKTGLSRQGWRVVIKPDDSHTKVHQLRKLITVGESYEPRTQKAATRISVHEVYGHALRGHQDSVAESEGFAILLEQLLDDRFKFRRSYRYLAAGLAWGVLGRPMDFRQTHEIIWRAMVIASAYSPEKAKRYAFDECARVFRGGVPSMPGAVYLKDGVYFDANIRMWQCLKDHPLNYNEFIDVIEGRRRILP